MVKQHIVLAVGWVLFCVLHSLLASIRLKQWMAKKTGKAFKYYRLYYSLFAFAGLAAILLYQFTLFSPYIILHPGNNSHSSKK